MKAQPQPVWKTFNLHRPSTLAAAEPGSLPGGALNQFSLNQPAAHRLPKHLPRPSLLLVSGAQTMETPVTCSMWELRPILGCLGPQPQREKVVSLSF